MSEKYIKKIDKLKERENYALKLQDYGIKLEQEFAKYRIFMDERDFDLVKEHNHKHQPAICVIHFKDMYIYPEIALDDKNLISMCELCVIDYIEAFKKYRKNHNLPKEREGGGIT